MNSSQFTPHRGVLILVLGILSLVLCQLLGPVAWILGKGDMAEIDSGRMDPEGHRLWRFKHYLNEMTAGETLGSILWMTPEMPWDFQHNVARHLWDEIRHSQLG